MSLRGAARRAGDVAISCHHCLTEDVAHGKIIALRESPSGKASAFQADIRGFESRLPLCLVVSGKRLESTRYFFGVASSWNRAQRIAALKRPWGIQTERLADHVIDLYLGKVVEAGNRCFLG